MRIVHFSDTHESGFPESVGAFFDKRLVGAMNCFFLRGRLHKPALLERAASLIAEMKPDLAVCSGDLTTSGQPGEFKRSLARLAPLLNSGVPVLYVPGNHDSYVKDKACRRALEEAFEAMNRGRFKLEGLPAAFDLGGCRFLAVDCARPTMPMLSCGFMDRRTVDFVKAECSAPKTGPRVIVGHFPLLETHPVKRVRHRLYGAVEVSGLLMSGALDLSLCGHVHKGYALLDANGRGEICAGSLTRFASFSEIEIDPASGRVSRRPVQIA